MEQILSCFQDCIDGKCGVIDMIDRSNNGKNIALQLEYIHGMSLESKSKIIRDVARRLRGCCHITF